MQNAKDSFYIALRNRMATAAPTRVVTLRGLQRPAICVEEAEAPAGELLLDCFVLRWTKQQSVNTSSGTLVQMTCEVMYASSGSQSNAGLDRGRDVAMMDALLLEMLQPQSVAKMNYGATPATAMQTNVFWTAPAFGALTTTRDRISRVTTVEVFAYQEPGEL